MALNNKSKKSSTDKIKKT